MQQKLEALLMVIVILLAFREGAFSLFLAAAVVSYLLQLLVFGPVLMQRAADAIAKKDPSKETHHYHQMYVALELIKIVALFGV